MRDLKSTVIKLQYFFLQSYICQIRNKCSPSVFSTSHISKHFMEYGANLIPFQDRSVLVVRQILNELLMDLDLETVIEDTEYRTQGTGDQGAVFDTGAQERVFDTGDQGAVFDTGAQERVFDTGAQERVFDTCSEERVFDAGSQERVFDTGSQERVFDTGSQERVFDTGSQERVVEYTLFDDSGYRTQDTANYGTTVDDTGAQERVLDTGSQERVFDTGSQERVFQYTVFDDTANQGTVVDNTGAQETMFKETGYRTQDTAVQRAEFRMMYQCEYCFKMFRHSQARNRHRKG